MKSTADVRSRLTAPVRYCVRSCRLTGTESGLTLIELIIAIAIIGAVGGTVLMAIYGLLTSSRQANDQQYAVSQLRQAESWMTEDVLMTWTINSSGFPLMLSWTGLVDEAHHEVTYTLEGPSGSLKRLQRYEVVDGTPSTLVVAEGIDGSASSCAFTAPILTVTLVASSGGHTETRAFEVKPRKTGITIDGS